MYSQLSDLFLAVFGVFVWVTLNSFFILEIDRSWSYIRGKEKSPYTGLSDLLSTRMFKKLSKKINMVIVFLTFPLLTYLILKFNLFGRFSTTRDLVPKSLVAGLGLSYFVVYFLFFLIFLQKKIGLNFISKSQAYTFFFSYLSIILIQVLLYMGMFFYVIVIL